MRGILTDINVQGQLEILLLVWRSLDWLATWEDLGLAVHTFRDLNLNREAPDSLVWQICQDRQLALITANRNDDGPESLETTLRNLNTVQSLPVFTLADPQRLKHEASYARRVAVKLLEYFMDIDRVRGTGRLYVP